MRNVSEDSGALDELVKIAGKDQAPCLVVDGKPIHEAKLIISHLVIQTSGIATDIPG